MSATGAITVSEQDALVARLILQAQAAEDDVVRARNAQQSLNELVASQQTMIQVAAHCPPSMWSLGMAVADRAHVLPLPPPIEPKDDSQVP